MYESTISVVNKDNHILNYVKNQISPYVYEIDGIASEVSGKGREYFSVACSDTFRFQMQRYLLTAVSESIARGYKNIYLRDILKIDGSNFYQNILVNTICVFDSDVDLQSIARIIDIDKPLYLDGYYNFKLNSVKKKWEELSKLVSENSYILNDNELILEFLQYLLETVPTKVKSLSVSFGENDFCLYGTNNRIIEKSASLAKYSSLEEEAMLNIICLKPQSVKIYANRLSEDFTDMSDVLFDAQYIKTE